MTVIAWDGVTVAADSMANEDGLSSTVTKLHTFKDGVLADVGELWACAAMRAWLTGDGAFPNVSGADASLIVFGPLGEVQEYQSTPYPLEEFSAPYAWGCGRDLALGAMLAGATAVEAARIACERSIYCGGPVHCWKPGKAVRIK